MKYKIQFSPQKNIIVNTKHNIRKIDENKLEITLDDIIVFEIENTDTKIKCNNVEFTKNTDDNKFHNFIIDTYIVNIMKTDEETIFIELLKQYTTKTPEFPIEEQEY